MRLTAGGIRELHWHDFAEWAYVTYGTCRITLLDPIGQAYVADVKEGELWFFPTGYPHSLQGLGPDGTEFILAFNSGQASEFSTLLVTDFLAHTRPISWRRISAFQPMRSRTYHCTIATFGRATCRDRSLPTRQPY
jgi:oxalate decarboxylase